MKEQFETIEQPQRKIRLQFPLSVKQIDERTIEMPVSDWRGTIISEQYEQHLTQQLGKKEAVTIIEEALHTMLMREITSHLRLV